MWQTRPSRRDLIAGAQSPIAAVLPWTGLESLGFRVYTRLLIKQPTYQRFTHVHLYPHGLLYFGDIFRAFNCVQPLGPEKTRMTLYNSVPRQIHWGLAGRLMQTVSMTIILRKWRKIFQEDVDRWPPVQRGLRHGCREERVCGIQRFMAEKLELAIPPVPARSSAAEDWPVAMASEISLSRT